MLRSNTVSGMVQDVHPKNQPKGKYPFALNAVLETTEGNLSTISNELGNILCANNFPDKTIIGSVQTDTNEVVLFLYHDAGRPEHEIGLYNPDSCNYTTIAKGECLNFSPQYPINAIFKVRENCEKVVYFTDNYNPYRVINITDTSDTVYPTTKFIISCDRLAYSRPTYNPVTIQTTLRNYGGSLDPGAYAYAVRYLDKSMNPTDFKYVTPFLPVGKGSLDLTNDVTTTMFYNGASANPSDPGYSTTTKSISLLLADLDTSFPYYQIGVIKRTSMDGSITGVDILYPTPMPETPLLTFVDTFVHTGNDDQILTQTSIDEVLVPKQWLHQVGAHAQINSQLYVGNIKNKQRDYSILQRHASKTKVEYVKKSVNDHDANVKDTTYYLTNGSFMPDEVYALGIVYVYNDGTESPVFHIPGRAPNTVTGSNPFITSFTNWDTDTITSDPNIFNPAKNKRWQVYNTATKYTTPYSSTDVSGLMGYYETTTNYPEIEACDGNSFWGEDWQGNTLTTSTKIRHHRMPSTELYKDLADRHYRIGIRFTNNEDYPDDSIRGHYYVYSDRTFEKTVLDKGILAPLPVEGSNGLYYQFPSIGFDIFNPLATTLNWIDTNSKSFGFISNKLLYDQKHHTPSYFRLEKTFNISYSSDSATVDNDVYEQVINARTAIVDFKNYVLPTTINYKVDNANYLAPSTTGVVPNSVYVPAENRVLENRSISTPLTVLSFDRTLDEVATSADPEIFSQLSFYGSLKADTDVFQNLSSIRYRRINSPLYTPTSSSANLYNGDVFVTYSQLQDLKWRQVSNLYAYCVFVNYITDDEINSEFRQGEDSQPQNNFFKWDFQNSHDRLRDYISHKYYEEIEDTALFYPERYLYNKSYSHINDLKSYFPLSHTYKYCSDCNEYFPNRIYASEVDTKESTYDPYRTILINNYKDNTADEGPITDLFVNFSDLYFTTPQVIKKVPTRPQTINTDADTVYIGTGAQFSLPFQPLTSNTFAFGGQTSFRSRVSTEYGTFYVDTLSSRPILLNQSLNDVSLNGMRNFFQENGRLTLDEQFKERTGVSYPIQSSSHIDGVGFTTTYDPRFKRIIIHKKDYQINKNYVNSLTYGVSTTPNTLYYDNGFFYNDSSASPTRVYLDNPQFFTPKSFTISYSLIHNSWVSFHSYLPSYLFNTHKDFFSVSSKPYKHNSGAHQTFYTTKYDYILDVITPLDPLMGKQANNLFYTSSSYKVADREYPTSTTFDRAVFYNDTQSSGLLDLKPKTLFDLDFNTSSAFVTKIDDYYRISNFRDRALDPTLPLWSSSYNDISASYYIDKVPFNISDVNFYEAARFRGHYLGTRLFFKPTENIKILTDLLSIQFEHKNR